MIVDRDVCRKPAEIEARLDPVVRDVEDADASDTADILEGQQSSVGQHRVCRRTVHRRRPRQAGVEVPE